MGLAEVISDMNSNYENRKHGGYSHVFDMQEKMLSIFPEVGIENIFASEMYLPIGQKIEPASLEKLKEVVEEFQTQNVIENTVKRKG